MYENLVDNHGLGPDTSKGCGDKRRAMWFEIPEDHATETAAVRLREDGPSRFQCRLGLNYILRGSDVYFGWLEPSPLVCSKMQRLFFFSNLLNPFPNP